MTYIRNRYILIVDIFFLAIIPFIALFLRVDMDSIHSYLSNSFGCFVVCSVLVKVFVFYIFKLYNRYWRYTSLEDAFSIFAAVSVSFALIVLMIIVNSSFKLFGGWSIPRSLPIIDAILTFLAVSATRVSVRALGARYINKCRKNNNLKRALIIGAGEAGMLLLRSLRSDVTNPYEIIGFLDDDDAKKALTCIGVPVLGGVPDLLSVAQKYEVEEVIIALPSSSGEKTKEIFELCEQLGVETKTLPSLNEIINGQINISTLRKVNIEDLLRRKPVRTDFSNVVEQLSGKIVLVTGAGGSIGSELCRQIANCGPDKLLLMGHGENSLFNICNELKLKNPFLPMEIIVADMRDRNRLEHIFSRYRPNVIFHAAAHKHVPMMEANVAEAVLNNVAGTKNLVKFALKYDVDCFVTISSDKAVNPTNVMGATKRVTELIVRQAGYKASKPFVSVRFGNVLGSRGSVVPMMQKQIAEGGPVTVTHPEMIRFFMTIPEASQLVLQAGAMGRAGDVFVLDMGKPVKILDLAKDLIELSGHKPDVDIKIKFTGLRPGEKLYEELFVKEEELAKTSNEKVFRASSAALPDDFEDQLDMLIKLAKSGNRSEIISQLHLLVPQFNHPVIKSQNPENSTNEELES